MNEVTPELIAQIATRLYNEIPGVNHIPKTDSEAMRRCARSVGHSRDSRRTAFAAGSSGRCAGGKRRAERSADRSRRPAGVRPTDQSAPFRSSAGVCGQTQDEDPIHRLFAGKSLPAEGARARWTCRPFAKSFPP